MVDFPEGISPASRFVPIERGIQRIVLTGFMGAGKSTVGRLLAERKGWVFLDMDVHIETTSGKSARELFVALGETGFRQLETDILRSVLQRNKAIVAPGGAVIDKCENQETLAKSKGSFVVFLDAPFRTLIDRCLRQEGQEGATYRPLLRKPEIAQAQYMERRALYAKHANWVLNVAEKPPEIIAQDIWQTVFAMH